MSSVNISAYINTIRTNRMGDRSEKATICADYQSAGIISSITFEVPIEQAKSFFVGQKINININWDINWE